METQEPWFKFISLSQLNASLWRKHYAQQTFLGITHYGLFFQLPFIAQQLSHYNIEKRECQPYFLRGFRYAQIEVNQMHDRDYPCEKPAWDDRI